jgi:NRAMP (natural resistance-associated macrophage protein)-like metal ion transporter
MATFLEKTLKVPQMGVDRTLRVSRYVGKVLFRQQPVKTAGEYWKKLGPGLTTGAADDDPSGIATYSQTGAQYGPQLLWLALFTYPFMAVVQEMCARIGLVTGQGLAGNIKAHYSRSVLYGCTILLFIANSFNIGADLGAMAKGAELIFPKFSFALLIIGFTVFSLLLQIFTSYKAYAHFLKWLALILFSYVAAAFVVHLDWGTVAWHTLVPHMGFSRNELFLVAAILGTTISPYLFFWQTSQEVEEKMMQGSTPVIMPRETSSQEIGNMRIDVWSGMFISNLVMFFIIAVCSATLYAHGVTNITTAADAASALRPLAGNYAYWLFAVGIIGTGLLAVPVLAGSASYAISESLNWKMGLYRKFNEAYAFYGVIIVSMIIGLMLNFTKLDPIKALIYSAVANCIVAPIVLVLIVGISGNKKIMGENVNSRTTSAIGWIVTAVMAVVAVATVVSLLF